jgi:RNA polymerase sigma-B factor
MPTVNARKLTEEEIQERLAAYAAKPDRRVRDEIVLQYSNLVESIARRFLGACEPLEDLSQEGYIGLIRSVDKYDVNQGVKFSTYATHFIIGEIKHYLRDKGKMIKEPAWLQELNQRMTRVIESLSQKHNRQPTEKEIAEVMQMPEQQVREMLTTREVFKVSSLDGDKEDSPNAKDSEKIKDQKMVSFQLPVEDKIVLETSLQRLKDIEKEVIAAHYYKGLNQTEIAKAHGISCNYVSHILRNSTKKLKKILQTEEIRDSQMQRTLISQRTGAAAANAAMSVIDPATGTYNGDYFTERLDEEISRAYRDGHKLAIVLINVSLPDDLNPLVRMVRLDDVLYEVAQTMRSSIRKLDVLARIGETCFAVILPHTAQHVTTVAERLCGSISGVQADTGYKGRKLKPSAVYGTARYPADGVTVRDMLTRAAQELGTPYEKLTEKPEELRKAA